MDIKENHRLVEMFADGSCLGNPGPGGYCAVLRYGDAEKQISGCEEKTTNNRMELMAVIAGLRHLKRPCRVRITTDSNYVVKGMTSWIHRWIRANWINSGGKPVVNRDLWEELLELSRRHTIEWQWIKGHNGHKENERCDKAAKEAIEKCKAIHP
ncbi:MAG: ribonuclease HI [Desulfobacteraceae bacterium]|jgi:ribonuclease HI|nr:MAG: ribonuclease HI [Desulfobacteraceae bacterium]